MPNGKHKKLKTRGSMTYGGDDQRWIIHAAEPNQAGY
jgi:SET domain-containing protein